VISTLLHFAKVATTLFDNPRPLLAITVCIRRLLETSQESSLQREQISIALDDLKILRSLCKNTAESAGQAKPWNAGSSMNTSAGA
jgi:hypothetical protein